MDIVVNILLLCQMPVIKRMPDTNINKKKENKKIKEKKNKKKKEEIEKVNKE
jgi:hypothetical protein